MPGCKNPIQEELKAYLDGELTGLRRVAVQRHLEQCPHCRTERDALQRLSQALATLPAPEPLSPALRTRILGQLPGPAVPLPPRPPLWRRLGPLAGVGGLAAVAAMLFLQRQAPTETFSAAAPQTRAAMDKLRVTAQAAPPPHAPVSTKGSRGGGGFGGGGIVLPLRLKVPQGKAAETLVTLRRRLQELRIPESQSAKSPGQVWVVVPSEKRTALRVALEQLGELLEGSDMLAGSGAGSPLVFVLTIEE